VVVLDERQDRAEVVRQARNVGYDTILGELDGGMDAWLGDDRASASIPLADVARYYGTVVDVRQRSEFAAGHIPGAVSAELGDISLQAIPNGPVAIMCGHGERAITAASLLERDGRHNVTVLTGGPDDWARAHGRLETGA
jgi:rhodanese-related sulfurtransferase